MPDCSAFVVPLFFSDIHLRSHVYIVSEMYRIAKRYHSCHTYSNLRQKQKEIRAMRAGYQRRTSALTH
jgi:hypothetical protein